MISFSPRKQTPRAQLPIPTEKLVEVESGKGVISYDIYTPPPEKDLKETILCLPGLGDTKREYELFVPAMLELGYTAITVDLRGNGKSRGKFSSFSMNEVVKDVNAILSAEHIEKVILAGCSYAGPVAGLFSIEWPEKTKGLILINPIMRTPAAMSASMLAIALKTPYVGKTLWKNYYKSLYPLNPVDKEYLKHIIENCKLPGTMKSIAGMATAARLDGKISEINKPTLLIFGSRDPDFSDPTLEAKKIHKLINNSKTIVIDGAGHYPHRECPNVVIPQVTEWLSTVH